MAIAIYADDQEFGVMHYGLPRSEDRAAIRQRMENTARSFGLTGSDLFSKAISRFESFDFDKVERKLDALKRKVTHLFDRDEIRPMWKIGQFQQAGPVQQRWLMANPRAQKLFEADMMYGWRDTFVNHHKGRYGEENPDYRAVMDGLVVFNEEGGAVCTQFLTDRDADNRGVLNFSDQTLVHGSMWANFGAFLDEGLDDPGDPNNGSL
ncbi:hypothetical protein PA10_00149 [Pseudomonas phage pPa_SNUABM_DT01]|nr:hypothetical protein PA10_00149 [Pseudomonas phage pPa_SNUABM_DT01]